MKKLLKEYSLNSDMQYFEMIVESVINGQITQAKYQFLAMTKEYRKKFVLSLIRDWNSDLNHKECEMFINLI